MILHNKWNRGLRRAAELSIVRATACALAGLLICGTAAAQTAGPVIRVEEDWLLSVAAPSPEANVPQVVTVFGPADPDTDTYAVFEINHGTMPQFRPGGMQLQCWYHQNLLGYGNHPNNREFDAAVDTITYTTATYLSGGRLYMEVLKGTSINWGPFGGQGYLRMSLLTSRLNLDDYDSQHSTKHSRISFGKHRVNEFTRTEVRYYASTGLVRTEEEDVVVHSQVANTNPPVAASEPGAVTE